MRTQDLAQAAKNLKENDDFKLIMESIEGDIFRAFKNTKIGANEELQNVHALAHGFKLLNNSIDKYIELAIFEAAKDENY
ncbi:hypothetical protein [Mycoplana ramosa]|uniref:Uncharacterized protein n=1 Tax=Mycoplana ramosa TaxID=40837 RepID=A0ABW3YTC9_MYCRA